MGQLASNPPNPPTAEERLESWKEIAAYLKKSVRTVQDWEKKEGLPVHRRVHDKLGTVYAYRAELDAWWRNGQPRLEAKEAEETQEAKE
ncbi:MAG: helix-turn-helix domain-containing protein, partial [Acidobacteria bacterium]|nr:helix-turn-helix domain-containing protein [Acidobacteriota bacterium]